jgi:hypothetical protein
MKFKVRRIGNSYRIYLWPREEWNGDPHIEGEAAFTGFSDMQRLLLGTHFGGDNSDLSANIGIGPLFLHVGLVGFISGRIRTISYTKWAKRLAEIASQKRGETIHAYQVDPLDGRDLIRISVFDGSVWISFWHNGQGWSRDDKKHAPWFTNGWEWTFNVVDRILGKRDYETQGKTEPKDCKVNLPEGQYRAKFSTWRCRWFRKRSPFGRRWKWRCEIEVPGGIPIPGKGSAAYNCGEDATHSVCFGAQDEMDTEYSAGNRLAIDVIKRRQKYSGGAGWKPEAGEWIKCNKCGAIANNGYPVSAAFRGDYTAWACLTCQPVKPTWLLLTDKTTNSGKSLFRCDTCSHEQPTPDKVCPCCGGQKPKQELRCEAKI